MSNVQSFTQRAIADALPVAKTSFLDQASKIHAFSLLLWSIYNFMVDKESGQVEYAVLQFGGFLGMGSDYYPVPWAALEYDEEEGGYVIDVDKEFLENAPRYAPYETPRFTPGYGSQIDNVYGAEYEDA